EPGLSADDLVPDPPRSDQDPTEFPGSDRGVATLRIPCQLAARVFHYRVASGPGTPPGTPRTRGPARRTDHGTRECLPRMWRAAVAQRPSWPLPAVPDPPGSGGRDQVEDRTGPGRGERAGDPGRHRRADPARPAPRHRPGDRPGAAGPPL